MLLEFTELSSEWFWEQDQEFRFVRFFGMSTEKLHRSQQLFIGRRRWEMPVMGVSAEEIEAHKACYQQHQPFHDFEYQVEGDNGVIQRYSVSGYPFYDANGDFAGYRGTGRNLTELRQAQASAAHSKSQLLQILQGNPVPVFVLDTAHRISHWNRACEALTGIKAIMAIGSTESWRGFYAEPRPSMADLVVDQASEAEIRRHYSGKLRSSPLTSGAYETEEFFPEMSDHGLWLNINVSPLHDSAGNLIGAVETLQDISHRVEAEQAEQQRHQELCQAHAELQATLQQLAEAKKLASLGRMIAGVAHELNTPLGNILLGLSSHQSSLEHLQSAYQSQTLSKAQLESHILDTEKSLGLIEQNLSRSINLINRLQELAGDPDQGQSQQFNPFQIVEEVIALSDRECSQRRISIHNRVPPALNFHSYKAAFEQVLFILIENALTHAFPEERGGQIELDARISEQQLCLSVADNGIGLTEQTRNNAFDPFFSSNLGQGNTGLGLYRAYTLITAVMGGTVTLQDNNPGLSVQIRLPAGTG